MLIITSKMAAYEEEITHLFLQHAYDTDKFQTYADVTGSLTDESVDGCDVCRRFLEDWPE